jgi:hypothetical protein
MLKFALLFLAFALSPTLASANEYCVSQYADQIGKANTELATIVKRQEQIDARIALIYQEQSKIAAEIANEAIKVPPNNSRIAELGKRLGEINREKTGLEQEGYNNQDRVVALKGVIPAELQGKLRGCVEASAPANNLVNLAIQTLAILSTGGASLTLPPKTLYVDMSAVLNGYPTGGDSSIINEAREAALKALPGGLGSSGNDVGKILRDPGRIIRCPFGC